MNTLGTFILTASIASLSGTTLAAAPQGHGIFGQPVSDAQLAQMRGRFVEGDNILFFGVRMSTEWLLSDGTLHEMEMQFNVDFNGGNFEPQLTLYTAAPTTTAGSGSGDTGTPGTVVNESLDNNISGVVQNIQVAGDGNSVLNDVTWEVTDQEIDPGTDGLTPIENASNSITISDGITTQVKVEGNNIGYSIGVPGQGTVQQQLSSNSIHGLLQSTQLTGDINRVLNQMHLQIRVDPNARSQNLQNLRRTLSNLRGLN